MASESHSLEDTPTWVVAIVVFVIVFISFLAERGLHKLGKFFKRKDQDALFDALEKLKEELMLVGFISLLLTVSQTLIASHVCISPRLASIMLPCKREKVPSAGTHHDIINRRRLLAENITLEHCAHKGRVPLLSVEALHQLHIFVFVLAIVHVIFCVTTMFLGSLKINQWKHWENEIRNEISRTHHAHAVHLHHLQKFKERAGNFWRRFTVVSWVAAFFKQFYGSVTKSDYIALRAGFINAHCPRHPKFDFHKYMLRTLEYDFKKIVDISWYLWLFVVLFLLINIGGWHTYFWLAFLPLVLLLLVGAKLEHIITELAKEVAESPEATRVKPSDELFWFHKPSLFLFLIHFILFQNAFELGFFFWIWSAYGFKTCIMEQWGFIIPRLVMGVIVQVLCSYSTLPLYALVTQMGSSFKQGMFDEYITGYLKDWMRSIRLDSSTNPNRMAQEPFESISAAERPRDSLGIPLSTISDSQPNSTQITTSST